MIQAAIGEARKTQAFATSAGVPIRVSGAAARQRATPSGQSSSSPGRAMSPGDTVLTRMPTRPVLDRRGTRVHDHRRLRCVVVRVAQCRVAALDRGDVDDRPAVLRRHHTRRGLRHREHRGQVHVHDGAPVRKRHRRQGLHGLHRCVVDEDVEPPEGAHGGFDQGFAGRLVDEVPTDGDRLSSPALQCRDEGLRLCDRGPVVDDNARAGGRETPADARPDARADPLAGHARAAGDDDDGAIEFHHPGPSSRGAGSGRRRSRRRTCREASRRGGPRGCRARRTRTRSGPG